MDNMTIHACAEERTKPAWMVLRLLEFGKQLKQAANVIYDFVRLATR